MPVARKVWQPILARVPSSAVRRWIMLQASTRFIAVTVSVPVRPARADFAQLKAGDDAAQVEVVGNWRDRSLAFDHRQMIEDSLKAPELCISQRS